MEANRDRFRQNVHEPLKEITKFLGENVINNFKGVDFDTDISHNLSRLRKNLYGRKVANPYHDNYWSAFFRKKVIR